MSSVTGYRGGPPMHVGISYGDPNAGIHGAFAVLAALWHREETGEGQYIDLSQWETSMVVLPEAFLAAQMQGAPPERNGNRDPIMTPHGIFRAAGDDRWIAIAVRDDDEWRRLATLMDAPHLATDPRFATAAARKANEDAVEELVATWTARATPEELTRVLQDAGVPAFTATTNRDLHDDPHLGARGFFVELPHPEVGVRRHLGIPWRMSETPCAVERPAPCLGEGTEYVLGEILGLDAAARADLRARGVVA
jgi:crotonobetainyl-CoA:carnitine CoA-transferase CaiB-like acyl-CoA transferase